MLKFVRKSSHAASSTKDDFGGGDARCVTSHQRRKSIGTYRGGIVAAFKSTDNSMTTTTGNVAITNTATTNVNDSKRDIVTSPDELKSRLQQDRRLGELMSRAAANRLDDQRGTSSCSYELPEFLKIANHNDRCDMSRTTHESTERRLFSDASGDDSTNISTVQIDDSTAQHTNGRVHPVSLNRLSTNVSSSRSTTSPPLPPPIYATSVRSDVTTTPTDSELNTPWQVDYV